MDTSCFAESAGLEPGLSHQELEVFAFQYGIRFLLCNLRRPRDLDAGAVLHTIGHSSGRMRDQQCGPLNLDEKLQQDDLIVE